MKNFALLKCALMVAIGFIGFQMLAQAEETKSIPEGRVAAFRERMQEVAAKLGLSEEQKEKIKPIIREEMEKARALRKDESLSRQDKVKKLKAIREEIVPKLKAILTSEQFEKWRKMAEERRARLQEK